MTLPQIPCICPADLSRIPSVASHPSPPQQPANGFCNPTSAPCLDLGLGQVPLGTAAGTPKLAPTPTPQARKTRSTGANGCTLAHVHHRMSPAPRLRRHQMMGSPTSALMGAPWKTVSGGSWGIQCVRGQARKALAGEIQSPGGGINLFLKASHAL